MRSRIPILLVGVVISMIVAGPAEVQEFNSFDDIGLTYNELGTIVDLTQLYVTLKVFEEHFGSLDGNVPEGWMDIAMLANLIDPSFTDSLVGHDRWGSPLHIRVLDNEILLASAGADGVNQSVEAINTIIANEQHSITRREVRATVGDDLLFCDGELVAGPRSTSEILKITMADMRTIGTATEAFAVDSAHYPPLPAGFVGGAALRDFLSPVYVKRMPELDGWGNSFMFRYEARHYLIVSFGADGLPQSNYEHGDLESFYSAPNGYSSTGDDIVYSNGLFVSYPEEIVHR